jgi:hypothetical protein
MVGAGQAVVEQHRVQPLLPGGALIDQGLAQPHQHPQLQQMRRWDPRLRQAVLFQQLPQQLGVVRSVLARRLGPRRAAVSAGSAR